MFYLHRREPLVFQEKSKHNDGLALAPPAINQAHNYDLGAGF
jgi:hypothetical protein